MLSEVVAPGWEDIPELTGPVRMAIDGKSRDVHRAWQSRAGNEVVLIALAVDDLEVPSTVLSATVYLPSRALVAEADPQASEILTSFDLAEASGRRPLILHLFKGELAKSLIVGFSSLTTGSS